MQIRQVNDLFQSGLILGLVAFFSVAVLADLRQPAHTDSATMQIAKTAKEARHA